MEDSIQSIIKSAKEYLPTLDSKRVEEAYSLAKKAHEGQVRYSGDPYISHVLATAELLLPLKPDEETILAALLHDVPEDTNFTLSQIEKQFGTDVAGLVEGIGKLSLVRVQQGQAEVESWRKMFLAMAKDLRVIFIKLADRLHNMQTLEYVAKDKQLRIAEETLRVYAPIASRLGIYAMKGPLEDLCFKHLHPKEYEDLKVQVEAHGRLDPKYLKKAQEILVEFLKEEDIEGEVSSRVKHLYSIYKKLKRKNANSIDSIYDLFAMRIVLSDQQREGKEFLGHCYTTLGAIHNSWTPMYGRFKDYIAVPKINGYRSLHTTVIGKTVLRNHPVELQIRTSSMHREAEYGVASHWWYKDNTPETLSFSRHDLQNILHERRLLKRFHNLLDKQPDRRAEFEKVLSRQTYFDEELEIFLRRGGFSKNEISDLEDALVSTTKNDELKMFKHHVDWLYGLEQLQEDLMDSPDEEAEIDRMDVNVFQDRIFVLTPHGDVKDLPQDSTAVDFAYAIHSDVGNRCHQAKVNGSIIRLDQPLNSGDVVEIVTRKNPDPNRYWLSFVKTSHAKARIKAWFRTQDREKTVKIGRELINKELRRLNKPLLGPNCGLLKYYGGKKALSFSDRENIVELIGNGSMHVGTLIRNLFSERELMQEEAEHYLDKQIEVEEPEDEGPQDKVLITGESDLPTVLSACCKPRFPSPIVGYVTRGNSIRVHKNGCYQLKKVDKSRLLEATWASEDGKKKYQIKIRIESEDRVGLLRDVLGVVADMGNYVVDFPLIGKKKGKVIRTLIVEMSGYNTLAELLRKLEKLDGVISVQKV